MKYIITIVAVLILGYFVWGAIQTKPEPTVPQAVVSDTAPTPAQDNPSTNPAFTTPEQPSAAQTLQVDNTQVAIAFKGFGPGKVHDGSFSKIDSKLSFDAKGKLAGSVSIDMNSLQTDNEKLTTHLKSKDFFDTAVYPTATFVPKEFSGTQVKGDLTIKGSTKSITVPMVYKKTVAAPNVRLAYPAAYTADFTIDLKNFGIDQKFANSTVQIILTVPVK